MRLALLAALAVSAAAPALPAPAQYALTLAGLRVGAFTLDGEESGGSYKAAIEFRTSGLAGLLDYALAGSATGTVEKGGARAPVLFTGRSESPRARRRTRIEWTDGTPSFVAVDPPRAESVDAPETAGSVDPASALLEIGSPLRTDTACGTHLDIFDGSRLVRLDLGAPLAADDGIACDGFYTRLGGEPLTPIDPPECPFRLLYRRGPDRRIVLDEIRIPTRFGLALIKRST